MTKKVEIEQIVFLLYVALKKPEIDILAKITGIPKSKLNEWKNKNVWDEKFLSANEKINELLFENNYNNPISIKKSSIQLIIDFIHSILQRLDQMKSNIDDMEIDEILKTTQILSRAVPPLSKIINQIEENNKITKEDEHWLKTLNQNKEIQVAAQNLMFKIQEMEKQLDL